MDGNRFDDIVRTLGAGRSRRGVLKTFAAALGAVGLTSVGATADAKEAKITLCHKPGTAAEHAITVAQSAVPAHVRHGDYVGECCADDVLTCVDPATGQGTCCPATTNPCATTVCNADGSCGEAPANEGAVCGEAADACSAAPVCTGTATACPAAVSACTGGPCINGTCAEACAASEPGACNAYSACGQTAAGNGCVCQEAGNAVVCGTFGTCTQLCDSDADCADVVDFAGERGPGFCHTATCCDTQGHAGACVPLCGSATAA